MIKEIIEFITSVMARGRATSTVTMLSCAHTARDNASDGD